MKIIHTNNIILLAFLFQANIFFAQTYKGSGMRRENMPKEGIIKGVVFDKQTDKTVQFANAALFSMRDSSVVAGVVADENGSFELNNLPYGRYYLIVDFIGYYKNTISNLKINQKDKINDLGIIFLNQSAENIEAVEITGERNFVEYKIDRKLINISKNINASGGTIVDALENAPSLQVDIDGNVLMRGSSNFIVLIDGKPSVLEANDILQQIPVSVVENVEIITNPSVKYDPDGTTGIINIIMKKEHKSGFSGIINTSLGTGDKYSADFLLNYRIKKLNYYIGANYGDRTHTSTGNSLLQTDLNDTTRFLNSTSGRNHTRKYYSVKGGIDYSMDKKNSLSVSGKYGYFGFAMGTSSQNEEYTLPITTNIYSYNTGLYEVNGGFYSGSVDFTHKFNKKGHEFFAFAEYSGRSGGLDNLVIENVTNNDYSKITNTTKYKTFQNREKQIIRLKLDYSYPINQKMKLEAGLQSRLRNTPGDYILENYILGNWLKDETLSNSFLYIRNIHSAYSTLSGDLFGLQFMLGIRGEYTDRIIEQKTSGDSYPYNFLDFFPSLHLTKKLSETQQIQASYSRRINRPRHWYMNPFPSYSDSYSERVGNPELLPEYLDSYELSFNKRFRKSFFNVEAYFRKTNDKITRVQDLMNDGRILNTFENLDKQTAFGTEFSGNIQLQKWWTMYANVNIYNYNIETEGVSGNLQSTNYDFRLNTTFMFSRNSRLQLNGIYNAPTVTSQGYREGFYYIGAAFKQEFLKRKLSLVLKVRDIFQTGNYIYNIEGDGFYSHGERIRESPVFTLSLSYKINNYKKKIVSREGMGEEGEGGM